MVKNCASSKRDKNWFGFSKTVAFSIQSIVFVIVNLFKSPSTTVNVFFSLFTLKINKENSSSVFHFSHAAIFIAYGMSKNGYIFALIWF